MITRRARASRVTLFATVPLLALVTLASGCGTASAPPSGGESSSSPSASAHPSGGGTPTTAPSPVPTTTGGTVTPGVPPCTGWPTRAPHEALPASFIPVAVLRCVTSYQTIPGKGQWETATLERADKDLGTLITALRLPPGHTSPGIMCPDIAMLPPQIVLIDASGTQIIPRLPIGRCGLVASQVLAALAKLPWQPVSVRLIAQVQTPGEISSGCTPGFKDPFVVYGSPQPSLGGAIYTTLPASLRICVYSVSGSLSTSQFLRGTTVTGATESALLAGLSGARTTSMCTLPHAQFAVLAGDPSFPLIYVEMGGCYRVLRYETEGGGLMGLSTGQATQQAVAIINTVTHPKP
jgi:hypothetical protein